MTFSEAVQSGFQNYVVFGGRTPRSGYWWWTLFAILVSVVAAVIDGVIGIKVVQGLTGLALFLPGLAVSVRRLHDVGKSGWNYLWILTIIGILYVLYLDLQPGTQGPNEYGPDPFATPTDTAAF